MSLYHIIKMESVLCHYSGSCTVMHEAKVNNANGKGLKVSNSDSNL